MSAQSLRVSLQEDRLSFGILRPVGDWEYAVFIPAGLDPRHSLHSHPSDASVSVMA
jgi:hypothetical protein